MNTNKTERITLYAVDDSGELVTAKARKAAETYCIDEYSGGYWPHSTRIPRNPIFDRIIHYSPVDALKAYISSQYAKRDAVDAKIDKATDMLEEVKRGQRNDQ